MSDNKPLTDKQKKVIDLMVNDKSMIKDKNGIPAGEVPAEKIFNAVTKLTIGTAETLKIAGIIDITRNLGKVTLSFTNKGKRLVANETNKTQTQETTEMNRKSTTTVQTGNNGAATTATTETTAKVKKPIRWQLMARINGTTVMPQDAFAHVITGHVKMKDAKEKYESFGYTVKSGSTYEGYNLENGDETLELFYRDVTTKETVYFGPSESNGYKPDNIRIAKITNGVAEVINNSADVSLLTLYAAMKSATKKLSDEGLEAKGEPSFGYDVFKEGNRVYALRFINLDHDNRIETQLFETVEVNLLPTDEITEVKMPVKSERSSAGRTSSVKSRDRFNSSTVKAVTELLETFFMSPDGEEALTNLVNAFTQKMAAYQKEYANYPVVEKTARKPRAKKVCEGVQSESEESSSDSEGEESHQSNDEGEEEVNPNPSFIGDLDLDKDPLSVSA